MTLTVLFFAQARDRAGCSECVLDLPEGSHVGEALDSLRARYPGLEALVPHLAVAMNGELVSREAPLHAGAELALLPPVSGG